MTENPNQTVVHFKLNGRLRHDVVPDNMLLVDYLRERVGLTGTKIGCDGGECGCCTVLVDDEPRHACLTLAAIIDGTNLETIEALETDGRLAAIQRGFDKKLGAQCGFCTPGMVMAAEGLLRTIPDPNDDDIRAGLASNICRCTGYVKIIDAVHFAADQLAGRKEAVE